MPKKRKYGKLPKAKAGLAVWERALDRMKTVDAYNRKLEADAKKKETIIKKAREYKSRGVGR